MTEWIWIGDRNAGRQGGVPLALAAEGISPPLETIKKRICPALRRGRGTRLSYPGNSERYCYNEEAAADDLVDIELEKRR